jgi:hypothetical protein
MMNISPVFVIFTIVLAIILSQAFLLWVALVITDWFKHREIKPPEIIIESMSNESLMR